MRVTNIELIKIDCLIRHSLINYSKFHDRRLEFGLFNTMQYTPDGPYTAKTTVPVSFDGKNIGDMNIIGFSPFDGTGNDSSYNLNQIDFGKFKTDNYDLNSLIPRSKQDIICEGYFPLFSIKQNGDHFFHLTQLKELLLKKNGDEKYSIIPNFMLGPDKKTLDLILSGARSPKPRVYFTTVDINGIGRFGDPHSVCRTSSLEKYLQVGGFLSIKDKCNPLLKLAKEKWILPKMKRMR